MEWEKIVHKLRDGERIYDDGYDVEIDNIKSNIYLAGPVNSFNRSARVREEAQGAANSIPTVNLVDPLRSEPNTREKIPPHDLQLIADCDALVAYYSDGVESWGTTAEMYVAAQLNKPVVLWVLDSPKHNEYSPWLESVIDGKYDRFRPAIHKTIELI